MLEIRVSNLKLLLAPKAGKTKMKQIDALKTKQINDFFFSSFLSRTGLQERLQPIQSVLVG